MPTIGRSGAFDAMIFRNDHGPPAFSCVRRRFLVKFTIADCTLLSRQGRIRRRDIRLVGTWGQKHQIELCLNWDLARAGSPPKKIDDYRMLYEMPKPFLMPATPWR